MPRRRPLPVALITAAACVAGLAAGPGAVSAAMTSAPPAAGPSQPASAQVEDVVAGMSLDELIGQMTWTHVYGAAAGDTSMAAENQARYGVDTPGEVIEKYALGGVLYFAWAGNTETPDQVAQLSAGLQQSAGATGAGVPLAVTVDQEGGPVSRIGEPATALPGGMALGATADPELARAQGEVLGSELAAMGINVDFAPVVDLNTNPANPVIGMRSMGEDPELVGELGAAQIEGMQSEHVASAAKHFPGHGDTDVDSHTGLPVVSGGRAALEEHLQPFQHAVDAGVDIVMSAHIVVESLDPDLPGTLSPAVLADVLRGELGYDGLITTDALDMQALKQLPGNPLDDADIAVLAIQAGSDILLDSPDVDAAVAGIHEALETGELDRERLEESVARILRWKAERGVWVPGGEAPAPPSLDVVGSEDHRATAEAISEHAATLLRNDGDMLPLDPDSDSLLVAGAGSAMPERLTPLLADEGFEVVERLESGPEPSAGYRASMLEAAGQADAVVVVVDDASGVTPQQQLVEELSAGPAPVTVVLAGAPYDLAAVSDGAAAIIAGYGSASINFRGIARVLSGASDPAGRLPVTVAGPDGSVIAELGFGLRTTVEVTPEPVELVDEPGTAADAVVIPAVEGVSYLIDGEPVAAGSQPATGTVSITAEADDGYHLALDATAEWSHTFDSAEAPTEPEAGDGDGDEGGFPLWLAGVGAAVIVAVAAAVILRRRR